MFFTLPGQEDEIAANVDKYMDSYARDTSVDELEEVRVWSASFGKTAGQSMLKPDVDIAIILPRFSKQ